MAADPLFDAWAERILGTDACRTDVTMLERRPDLAPEILAALLAKSGTAELAEHIAALTEVGDRRRFASARSIFVAHGPLIMFSLAAASLPECYTIGKAVGVLERTGRLTCDMHGRMYRTAQFILDAMGPASFTSLEDGLAAILRPRLIHAIVRQRQKGHGATAISVDDQLFTLAAFSWVSLRTLDRCRAAISAEARSDWIYRWGAIGVMMGLDRRRIPWSESDNSHAFARYQSEHGRRTIAGRTLRKALIAFLADMLGGRQLGAVLARRLVRELTSERTVELLGMAPDGGYEELLGRIVRRALVERPTRSWITRRFMAGFLANTESSFPFRLPTELARAWQ